jgi:hypothetical protein
MNKQTVRDSQPVGGLVVIRETELVGLALCVFGLGLLIGMGMGLA